MIPKTKIGQFIAVFTRSTAPAVELLSEFKQQNQIHSIKILYRIKIR